LGVQDEYHIQKTGCDKSGAFRLGKNGWEMWNGKQQCNVADSKQMMMTMTNLMVVMIITIQLAGF
jgi:hypothetical protein